jgi:hypothetical protein
VLLLLFAGDREEGRAILVLTTLPGLVLLALPGLGRAFGALFLRETGGSAPVVLALETLRAIGARRKRRDRSFVPLTRSAFWERLSRPDAIEAAPDGTLVFRGLLPHLTWSRARRLSVGRDFWSVAAERPVLERGRLVYSYRLEPLGDPSPGEPPFSPPPGDAYAEEVLTQVRREWDAFNAGFAWLTGMLPTDVQARAFHHRGGPVAARTATMGTAVGGGVLGLYLLSLLPGGPAADPLAPLVALLALGLLIDAGRRILATRQGRYGPSLFGFLLPSDALRPERVAWHAHRDAEREALARLADPGDSNSP